MNIEQKLDFLQHKHLGEWLKMKVKVNDEISDGQSLICMCGKLATGLHEMHCSKFKNKVNRECVKRLKHLIK
jgi:hypothetical protein